MKKCFALIILSLISAPGFACTIFVLTDSNRTLFCNNEDWFNPKTRIWFVPGSESKYGCVYVGFNNCYEQGGMNTKGLAYDWVTWWSNKRIKFEPGMIDYDGQVHKYMLETCASVEEAVAFYKKYKIYDFLSSRILIADKSGASVIIGAQDGKIFYDMMNKSRGFGYGGEKLDKLLADMPEPTVRNSVSILQACQQKGYAATKYSNIFNLKSGDIHLYALPQADTDVFLNLASELKKGAHYYDIPQIRQQITQGPMPLEGMECYNLTKAKPIPDKEPKIAEHIKAMIRDMTKGKMESKDYSKQAWDEILLNQKVLQQSLAEFGKLKTIALMECYDENGIRNYFYRLEFKRVWLLVHYKFDDQGKVVLFEPEDIYFKELGFFDGVLYWIFG
jgi:hypothetical protein